MFQAEETARLRFWDGHMLDIFEEQEQGQYSWNKVIEGAVGNGIRDTARG